MNDPAVSWLLVLVILAVSCPRLAASTTQPASRGPGDFNVLAFGAVGDGRTLSTEGIQRAIDACAEAGGGTVRIPAGRYVTGAIFLKSRITLQIDAGAVLLGSQNIEDYPVIAGRWEGRERRHYASLINGDGLEDIAIVGRGTIDGRGQFWWNARKKLRYDRGRLIGLYRCNNVLIRGLTLKNSPAWTVHPVYCRNVTISELTILNPEHSPNTDGINPDSCSNVRISNCHIDVGDDCIAIKSGRDEEGRRVGVACRNITITNCTMLAGHGGVVIGSEMSGGVRNVVISNCIFEGTRIGIRLKTQRGRGGVVEDIRVDNIVMRNVGTAIRLNMHYHDVPPEPVSERTPIFRNIHISNVTARDVQQAGYLKGLSEMPLADVTIRDAVFSGASGIWCRDAQNVSFSHIRIDARQGPALRCENVEGLEIEALRTDRPQPDAPVIELQDVRGVFVRGCWALVPTQTFLSITGQASRDIVLSGNELSRVAQPVRLGRGVDAKIVTQR